MIDILLVHTKMLHIPMLGRKEETSISLQDVNNIFGGNLRNVTI